MLCTKSLWRKALIIKMSLHLQFYPSLPHLKQKKWVLVSTPGYSPPPSVGAKPAALQPNPAFPMLEQLRLSP